VGFYSPLSVGSGFLSHNNPDSHKKSMYTNSLPPKKVAAEAEQQNLRRHALMEAARPVVIEILGGDEVGPSNIADRLNSIAIQTVEFVKSGHPLESIEDDDRREFIALLAPIAVGLDHRQIHGWLNGIEHDRQNLVRARRRREEAARQKEIKAHLLDCPSCKNSCAKAAVIPHEGGGGLLKCPKCKARLISSYRFFNVHAHRGASSGQIVKVYP
jgi:hypothetical protein